MSIKKSKSATRETSWPAKSLSIQFEVKRLADIVFTILILPVLFPLLVLIVQAMISRSSVVSRLNNDIYKR